MFSLHRQPRAIARVRIFLLHNATPRPHIYYRPFHPLQPAPPMCPGLSLSAALARTRRFECQKKPKKNTSRMPSPARETNHIILTRRVTVTRMPRQIFLLLSLIPMAVLPPTRKLHCGTD